MSNFKLPHFGALDTEALEEYYNAKVDFNHSEIQIDLNFESKTIELRPTSGGSTFY